LKPRLHCQYRGRLNTLHLLLLPDLLLARTALPPQEFSTCFVCTSQAPKTLPDHLLARGGVVPTYSVFRAEEAEIVLLPPDFLAKERPPILPHFSDAFLGAAIRTAIFRGACAYRQARSCLPRLDVTWVGRRYTVFQINSESIITPRFNHRKSFDCLSFLCWTRSEIQAN
jgi:hypothetical protein